MNMISAKSRRNASTFVSSSNPICPNASAENSTPEMPSFNPRTRIPPDRQPNGDRQRKDGQIDRH